MQLCLRTTVPQLGGKGHYLVADRLRSADIQIRLGDVGQVCRAAWRDVGTDIFRASLVSQQ
ncbi:hypothetical protein GQ53DRAFT_425710 [Thozetella sp. PMI_491]|nr:hypothetical protein GQ53DRAFT_425710 [Thozetella sp. PMI_491]